MFFAARKKTAFLVHQALDAKLFEEDPGFEPGLLLAYAPYEQRKRDVKNGVIFLKEVEVLVDEPTVKIVIILFFFLR